jgi:uncharacterized protein DUF4389
VMHDPTAAPPPYPARLDADLDPSLSRGLWLIKWLLALPHVVILVFLWIAAAFVGVIAWFAILFTGRYPRGLFDFTVGVLRWSWRVTYYAFEVLGTDRYPPFSLADDETYPARLQVDYPERLSRGLVLVKAWLLAIPQLIIVSVLVGGTNVALAGILTACAVIAMLFTTRYPPGLFQFLMGLERWAYRVAAYVLLLRDEYPPFRLDMGGGDPGTAAAMPPAPHAVPPPAPQDPDASW